MQYDEILQKGLTTSEAKELQEKYGKNELAEKEKEGIIAKILEVFSEPMFLLLIASAIIYFLLGEAKDGIVMMVFVLGMIFIDIFQELRTDKTLESLKDLSAPRIKVIRDSQEIMIESSNLVPRDVMIISEGVKIPADGKIIKCNDLCVDESSLTGESQGAWKDANDYVYSGTLVVQGLAYILVEKIGIETEYGKISVDVANVKEEKTPLQKQTGKITKICASISGILCLFVAIITYFNITDNEFKERIIQSILSGITVAMGTIPEEFPVILSVFLAMGAWRLAKQQSLVKKLPSVETLGQISVLCVDKTGTITKNKMSVENVININREENLAELMGMACEIDAYDPMENAILEYCNKMNLAKEEIFSGKLIKEYPFTNELKMMGHVWNKNNKIIVVAKGAVESILSICEISEEEKDTVETETNKMYNQGMRVIAVAKTELESENDIPESITDSKLVLCGLIGLIDPPRETVKEDIAICSRAGIRVVMITGDNGITASNIAKQIGIPNYENIVTGKELDKMSDEELKECVKTTNIFSRVIPEHKMRIVSAFKQNGEIVAMTGDGVNDSPALKMADIGIAMGKRGSEVSREAADLILLDDNFSTITSTIKDGRRIYDNIRKAIGYVITIHLPIAFMALIPPLLGATADNLLLLPIHVMLLELFVDPTCSVILERQPAEDNIMTRRPRNPKESILNMSALIKSSIQGIVILIASFGLYYITLINDGSIGVARTMGICSVILSSLFLVQTNTSNTDSVIHCIKKLSKDKIMWLMCIITILTVFIVIYTPINQFLKFEPLNLKQLITTILVAGISVFWYEIVKLFRKSVE